MLARVKRSRYRSNHLGVPPDVFPLQATSPAKRPGDLVGARAVRRVVGAWRSPAGQPPWVRPALIVIAAAAAITYAWGADSAYLEPFYGAAARSMSMSWHDFFFGAFDPAGTVTVDKLPGALWLQALSLRIFGFHIWAIVLPQILEGVATVLVLYRAVARLAGPVAAIVAAGALACSPVTVALARGNVSDSLLVLCLVLAADATCAALTSGRLRSLLLAGVWVGIAFQAKMMQAWLVLPALALAYGVAAPPPARTRAWHLLLAAAVTIVVSLSWMTAVTLVPAHERPYVDGSRNDSVFAQVFDYNGLARFGRNASADIGTPAPFLALQKRATLALDAFTFDVRASWHRLLSGPLGRDDGWLLPFALLGLAAALTARRRAPRGDPLRAAALLWGTWLLLHAAAFSVGEYLNSYYVAALAPATAALCGIGFSIWWQRRPQGRRLLAAALIASLAYDAYLLTGGTGVPRWLFPVAAAVTTLATLTLLDPPRRFAAAGAPALGFALSPLCALVIPAVTCVLMVAHGLGPFDPPYAPLTAVQKLAANQRALLAEGRAVGGAATGPNTPTWFATDTSQLADGPILFTGREVLPIGGYGGGVPAPTLAQLQADIADRKVLLFYLPVTPLGNDPRVIWVTKHCHTQNTTPLSPAGIRFAWFDCATTQA